MKTSNSVVQSSQSLRTVSLAFAVRCALAGFCAPALAATYTVTNTNDAGAGSLRQAILDANASGAPGGVVGGSNTVNITPAGTIILGSALPLIFSNLTINGNGNVVNGSDAHRCFVLSGLPTTFAGSAQAISVTLQNLQLNHCRAKGGDGGAATVSGGGGLGAGGAVFVNSNVSLVLSKITFSDNSAVGGNGGGSGSSAGGGGGGLTGNGNNGGGGLGGDGGIGQFAGGGGIGGPGGVGTSGGGGGGGFGNSGIGQISSAEGFGSASPGNLGILGGVNGGGGGGGGTGGTSGDSGSQTGSGGIGGNGGTGGAGGFNAGIGGGGGGGSALSNGGAGGFGGGGGSGFNYSYGGNGGFGGGGGTSGLSIAAGRPGGTGGFGGGGGAGYFSGTSLFGGGSGGGYESMAAFGGGKGGYKFGGGGGAMGGSIFVVDGGHVTISSNANVIGSSVIAGSPGGSDGRAQSGTSSGRGIFLQGNGELTVALDDTETSTIMDGITDVQGAGGGVGSGSWGLTLNSGTLALTASASLTGDVTIAGGTLELDAATLSTITVDTNGTLTGIGTAPNVLNNGIVSPGNASSTICLPSANYQLQAGGFSQSSTGSLRITADPCGGSTQLVVNGTAGVGGSLYMNFKGGPTVNETFTVMTATAINGSFADYQTNMPSVYGQIIYAPQSIQFKVLANDAIFINGFEEN